MEKILDFLLTILPYDLENGRMSIFKLPEAQGSFFIDAHKAAEYAAQHTGKSNIYFSLAAFGESAAKRGTEVDTVALMAVGIDIDLKSPAHQADNLPETEAEALEFVDLALPGMRPTIITNSGHGIQCFYVFKEPWEFSEDSDRVEAKQLCADIRHNYQYHMGKKGYKVDATFDLARIMRVGGTLNIKDPDNPKEVKVIEKSGMYYNKDSFEPLIVKEERKTIHDIVRARKGEDYDLVLDADASPPHAKMVGMLEDSDFADLWNKAIDKKLKAQTKENGKEGDSSLSLYDFRLCSKVVRQDWTPQEIADLIIAFRRRHAQKPKDIHKSLSMKYITRTLDNVFASYDKILDNSEMQQLNLEVQVIKRKKRAGEYVDPNEEKKVTQKTQDAASAFFGVKFKKLRKYMSDPPEYEIVFANGVTVKIGEAKYLLNQDNLRSKAFDITGVLPKTMKKAGFEILINFMGEEENMEKVQTSSDTRETDRMREWIRDYIGSYTLDPDLNSSFEGGQTPFTDNGRICIFGSRFRNYIATEKQERLGTKSFGVLMKRCGCDNVSMHFVRSKDGSETTANVYDVTKALK